MTIKKKQIKKESAKSIVVYIFMKYACVNFPRYYSTRFDTLSERIKFFQRSIAIVLLVTMHCQYLSMYNRKWQKYDNK